MMLEGCENISSSGWVDSHCLVIPRDGEQRTKCQGCNSAFKTVQLCISTNNKYNMTNNILSEEHSFYSLQTVQQSQVSH